MKRVTAFVTAVVLGAGLAAASSRHAAAFDPVPSRSPDVAAEAPTATKPPPLQIAPMEPVKMVLLVGELPAATGLHGIDALLDRGPDAEDLP
jgi:hypothetical protein